MPEVATDAATEVGTHVINKYIVDPIIRKICDAIHLDRNRGFLRKKVESKQRRLGEITDHFESQLRTVPDQGEVGDCLKSASDAIEDAKKLIEQSQLQQRYLNWISWAWDCIKPSISTQIRECTTEIDEHFNKLEHALQAFKRAQEAASLAPAKALPQPVPDEQLEGSAFKSAETELQKLLKEDPQVRVICVHGMPGVGKTSLLRTVYNSNKVCEAGKTFFTDVIWVTVSRKYEISDLQNQIAEVINLKEFSSIKNVASRQSMLFEILKNKKFLLMLDDLWSSLDLEQVFGVGFGVDKGSKVVFSTRFRNLTLTREQASIHVEPLWPEEGRVLFNRVAFEGRQVPEELKDCARKMADECNCLPLAITVVAAAMRRKTEEEAWNAALSLMKTVDPHFLDIDDRLDKDLYQKLRWSYEELRETENLQQCFLYCAMYPEDKKIDVDTLVRMWIAEGFVRSKEQTYSMDMEIGRQYVKRLIDRSLFQNVNFEKRVSMGNVKKPVNVWKGRYITVHDVIRDMAIYVAEKENLLYCQAGQQRKDFPQIRTEDCERISLFRNQIENLPQDFRCPKLVSLFLSENPSTSVPDTFLINLNSLRVLDLSHTRIESLPPSLAQLTSLEFLTLSSTNIKELPTAVCNLFRLQFLDLSKCSWLMSLPPEMSQLTSLKRLHLGMGMEIKALDDPTNVMALKGLTNLIELRLFLFSKFDALAAIMGTWLEMKHLYLHHINPTYVKYDLPDEMQKMKKLQSLVLVDYIGVRLPNWICEFQQLERLELDGSDNVKELPALEKLSKLKFLKLRNYRNVRDIGIGSSGFPMLKILHLSDMPKLRSMAKEGVAVTLLNLRVLKIQKCPVFRKFPGGMENSVHLMVYGHKGWWDNIIWEDNNMKLRLLESFKEI